MALRRRCCFLCAGGTRFLDQSGSGDEIGGGVPPLMTLPNLFLTKPLPLESLESEPEDSVEKGVPVLRRWEEPEGRSHALSRLLLKEPPESLPLLYPLRLAKSPSISSGKGKRFLLEEMDCKGVLVQCPAWLNSLGAGRMCQPEAPVSVSEEDIASVVPARAKTSQTVLMLIEDSLIVKIPPSGRAQQR